MVFSSAIFLFFFLPLVLLGHLVSGRRLRNVFLLLASLIFYSWGEGIYVLVILASICCNYLFGRLLDATTEQKRKELMLSVMVIINLLPLAFFKYLVFLVTTLNSLLKTADFALPVPAGIELPIGISFFTFQALSYLVDVYRHTSKSQRSVVDVGLYIALFPQLIAGPIVRYHDICEQIRGRVPSLVLFSSGVERFIFGLSKKMLLANPMGYMAEIIFSLPESELTFLAAWLGIICFALQIYFDFSGYSDMAIGLGRMFGFTFLENFNFPYIAISVRDFWSRWHISLSAWFRDYLYIPLGGNRHGNLKTARNLLIVFFICGLWHGASWNFIIWGLLHGLFLVMERSRWGAILGSLPKVIQHLYVILMVLTTWVFFRAETLDSSLQYLSTMYSWPNSLHMTTYVAIRLDIEFFTVLFFGLLFSTPVYFVLVEQYKKRIVRLGEAGLAVGHLVKVILLLSIFSLSVMEIAIGSFNPFIYFRF